MANPIPGAQLTTRVAAVLRAIGAEMPRGMGTSEVAQRLDLARPTAHRILASVAAEGFLDHDRVTGRWLLGPEMYLLGSVAANRYDVTPAARRAVRALSDATGESAFYSARRGDETVCLVAEEGSFPLRSHVLHEGIRFPLGVASAGIAILAFLPEAEVDAHLARTDLVARFGSAHAAPEIRRRLAATRDVGYSLNPGLIVEGSWGMGAAVFDSKGAPIGALSVTGVESRFRPDRQPELGRLLLEHAHAVTRELRPA